MSRVELRAMPDKTCPWCETVGGLSIYGDEIWSAQPLGTHSLAGGQLKVAAQSRAVAFLACSRCGNGKEGCLEVDDFGAWSAVFRPPFTSS